MNNFTIRPKIFKDESLTSYLLRLCISNGIVIKDLLNDLYTNYETTDVRNSHQVDINPIKTIDVSLLSESAKLNDIFLYENTFYGLISKFLSPEEFNSLNSTSTLIKDLFTTRKRKFCPACLQERLTYKLIWQVNDIFTCSIHNLPLSSICAKCGKEQPYLHMNLAQGKCKFCDVSLTTTQKISIDDKSLAYSSWLTTEWESLISLKIPFLNDDKEIAKRIFFLTGDKKEYFSINNINHLSKDYIYKLVGVLSKISSEKYGIGLNVLLRLLFKMNCTITDFIALSVPETFQDSLEAYLGKKSYIICLSPWCKSNGSNEKLVKINSLRSKTHNNLYLCLGCCIKYGVNKENGEWEEYGDLLSLGYQIVLPLINRGENRLQISKITGISRYKIYKLSSYFARFNLIRDVYVQNFIPGYKAIISIDNLIKFADINESKMRADVQKNLNIRLCDFYYFYYDSAIQEYLCSI